eukprot:TRINITY_DN93497_c0_g1_i1.p1 TRINITY_DN93497_c0_g1~~TRINITY_DN93497_c0_g1_i1.p1  ORF type:complete len:185 (+),score=15.87 TRINITY_DN93497_c0_g1_i1:75-629(+)
METPLNARIALDSAASNPFVRGAALHLKRRLAFRLARKHSKNSNQQQEEAPRRDGSSQAIKVEEEVLGNSGRSTKAGNFVVQVTGILSGEIVGTVELKSGCRWTYGYLRQELQGRINGLDDGDLVVEDDVKADNALLPLTQAGDTLAVQLVQGSACRKTIWQETVKPPRQTMTRLSRRLTGDDA